MNGVMLGLLAETSIHPGAGRSLGVVDLPVARESTSRYPVLVGSSLKGALVDLARSRKDSVRDKDVERVFGLPDRAGEVLVSDARLLLLPVRSLASAYRWVTCPLMIERLGRDLNRAGIPTNLPIPAIENDTALAAGDGPLFLEERAFTVSGSPSDALVTAIQALIQHKEVRDRLSKQLVVLSDDDFAWFAEFGLPVQARNQLEKDTKKSNNLWYEETLPPDTLMYSLLLSRTDEALTTVKNLFTQPDCYLQAGGNATVGQGWFAVAVHDGDAQQDRDAQRDGAQ